tara:strand:+ start:386 stop:583 length:198 start_codon:yes stop_codon:yes gene_type:complete
MFGDVSEMINKLKQAQQKVEKTKIRLHSVLVDETLFVSKIKETLATNREIKAFSIDISLISDAKN